MSALLTVGGRQLRMGSVPVVSVAPAGSIILPGPFTGYTSSPYQIYLGAFGLDFSSGDIPTTYQCGGYVIPATFPAGTAIKWNTIPVSAFISINGYLNMSWGNYSDSGGVITPEQVKNITTLTQAVDWTLAGTGTQDILGECFLTTTSHASGSLTDIVFEVGFLLKNSAASVSFVNANTVVGSFTDVNGVLWRVIRAVSGIGSAPNLVAYRDGFGDHHGPLDYKSFFTFLTSASVITGNEWMNGTAFGVETLQGVGQLTYNGFTTTYS
jgi:hypothetical protein